MYGPEENSPLSISNYQTSDEIIQLHSAKNFDDENEWLCRSIEKLIKTDGLRSDDIVVITLDDRFGKGILFSNWQFVI